MLQNFIWLAVILVCVENRSLLFLILFSLIKTTHAVNLGIYVRCVSIIYNSASNLKKHLSKSTKTNNDNNDNNNN
jgi:hypothetical protein